MAHQNDLGQKFKNKSLTSSTEVLTYQVRSRAQASEVNSLIIPRASQIWEPLAYVVP
jgi:hypothetical protein